ncbi:MAG: methylmalonyl-CoA epimerase [Chloroflexota bacterium]
MRVKIDHIGVAVRDVAEAMKPYALILGLDPEHIETEIVEEQKAKAALIPVGNSRIELIESTSPEGVIAKYIEKKGEGIHHIALEVDDVKAALEALKSKDIPLVDNEPRTGVGGSKVAFLHPKATKILIELVEH